MAYEIVADDEIDPATEAIPLRISILNRSEKDVQYLHAGDYYGVTFYVRRTEGKLEELKTSDSRFPRPQFARSLVTISPGQIQEIEITVPLRLFAENPAGVLFGVTIWQAAEKTWCTAFSPELPLSQVPQR